MTPYDFRNWLQAEAETAPLLLLFIGIPASGKSTFFHRVLEDRNMAYVSLDVLQTRAREKSAFDAAIAAHKSVVVDNTNVTMAFRARYIDPANSAGYRVVGLFFQSVLADCIARNERREGKAKIKNTALFGMSAQLELPAMDEEFDNLFFVKIADDNFQIDYWKDF